MRRLPPQHGQAGSDASPTVRFGFGFEAEPAADMLGDSVAGGRELETEAPDGMFARPPADGRSILHRRLTPPVR